MLQRHIDVFHEGGVLGDGIQQFLRDFIGISVEEADPLGMLGFDLWRFYLCEAREQQGETIL